MASYTRTVGPKADVNELIYVVALHQTSPNAGVRVDSKTISHLDILRFLKSRHGIEITPEQAKDIILAFGGPRATPEQRLELAHELREEHKQNLVQSHKDVWTSQASSSLRNKSSSDFYEDNLLAYNELNNSIVLVNEVLRPKTWYLDLVQMTNTLMIPTVLSLAKSWNDEKQEKKSNRGNTEDVVDEPQTFLSNVDRHKHVSDKENKTDLSPSNIFGLVVRNLHALASSRDFDRNIEITHDLVRHLLHEANEPEWANNNELVDEMVALAAKVSPFEKPLLNEETLIRCMTEDIQAWPLGYEDDVTTILQDIQKIQDWSKLDEKTEDPTSDTQDDKNHISEEPEEPEKLAFDGESVKNLSLEAKFLEELKISQKDDEDLWSPTEIKCESKLTMIDSVIDSHASTGVFIMTWLFYLSESVVISTYVLESADFTSACSESDFSCALFSTIGNWMLLAFTLSLSGILLVLPMSGGNHSRKRTTGYLFVSAISSLVIVGTLYSIAIYVRGERENLNEEEESLSEEVQQSVEYALGFGSVITFCYFINLLVAFMDSRSSGPLTGWAKDIQTTSDMKRSCDMKKAGRHKTDEILRNSLQIHLMSTSAEKNSSGVLVNDRSATTDTIFKNYVIHGEKAHKYSFGWAFKALYTGYLVESEGVWLPARMWIFQVGQLMVTVLLPLVLFRSIEGLAKEADEAREELPEDTPQWIKDLSVTGEQVRIALYPASIIATTVCAMIFVLYLPSTVDTIMRFRCGMIPSLGSSIFGEARTSPDMAYMNTANAIYAMIAAAGLFYVLVALCLFLFIWPFSQSIMILLCGWGIGIGITIGLKTFLTMFCRKAFYRAFYRVKEGGSNLASLALECWYIGIGGGILIGRLTQFLLAAAFWIGRIDVPFLADNVGLLGYKFDYVPLFFLQEILVHEAHRHPYMERLGALYLTRLARKDFVSRAGTCWRQLFVVALMPWLMEHRVHLKARIEDSVSDQKHEAQLVEDEDVNLQKLSHEFINSATAGQTTFVQVAQDVYEVVNDITTETVGIVKNAGSETVGIMKSALPKL